MTHNLILFALINKKKTQSTDEMKHESGCFSKERTKLLFKCLPVCENLSGFNFW